MARLLAAGVYYHLVSLIPSLLHPSQALLNVFREPQANFSDAQDFLTASDAKNTRLGGVLLTDFVKAFELVNPDWIMRVLQVRKAPLWLVAYVRYLLYGRLVVPKIHGALMSALKVLVGVDMGSALSPLLFCLALDPLLARLNHIPRILGVRAYMDDNQIWGSAKDASMQWLFQAMRLIEEYHPAGLQITQHTCCTLRAASAGGREDYEGGAGPSWQRAASAFLRSNLPHEAAWAGPFLLQPQEIRALAGQGAPFPHYLLIRLLQLPCKCKTKCSWLPTRQLSPEEIANLDSSTWGARILAESALVLGLQMQTPVGTGLQGFASRTKITSAGHRQVHFSKGAIKATARAALLSQAITPLPQRTLAFTAWIQSVT